MITLGWPQIIYGAYVALALGLFVRDHGKIETKRESAWPGIIGLVLMTALLAWGGFFRVPS